MARAADPGEPSPAGVANETTTANATKNSPVPTIMMTTAAN